MQAAVFYAPGDVRIEDIPVPEPGPGEVLIRIRRALTCGTDLKIYRRGHPTILQRVPTPFGHEFAGDIAAVGPEVDPRWREGMRVVAANSAPCNRCPYCRLGRQSLCENLEFLWGAYAGFIVVPRAIVEQNLYEIPASLSYAAACLTEPLACAVHGIDVMDIHVGDVIAVNGAGPIGLFFTRLASLRGARVISSDLGAGRLETAMHLGAWRTVNVSEVEDQVAAVRALTPGGRGADAAIEAVGLPEIWEKTVQMVRPGGTVNLFGGAKGGSSFSVSTTLLHYSELTIKGVFHHTPHYVQTALGLLATGQVPADPFISGERPLAEVTDALELMSRQQGIKYAIIPPGEGA
ncbi:MAG: zinc-binding dehydrogenase [Chloroflexota bacterium]